MSADPSAPAVRTRRHRGGRRVRPRARRSWPQRILLSFGALLSVLALGVAGVAGWMAYQWRSIDRADVALDAPDGGPANYLIVGSDSRSGGDPLDPSATDDRASLADTIILLRVDPGTEQARLLSLPRDLWVTLPDGGEGRINAAYAPGPQGLVDTVRRELDVPVHHYVEVDFTGFEELVAAVDGVPMWFDRAMRDRSSGLDVPHPGCVNLDGRAALAFARSRHLQYFEGGGFTHDGTGDLGRISRQQVFLRRVIDRAVDQGLGNPGTLKRLVEVGTANLTIDDTLAVTELIGLGQRFAAFDSGALETFTLPNTPRTTSGGAMVVDLDEAAAEPILDLFRPEDRAAATTTTTGDQPTTTAAAVDLVVLNSSGEQGLATEAADALAGAGFDVARVGNGEELGHATEDRSVVRYAPGADTEARAVEAAIEGGAALEEDADLDGDDVVLFLGGDFTGIAATATTAGATTTTTEAAGPDRPDEPIEAEVVGMVPPGDPPPGRSCG